MQLDPPVVADLQGHRAAVKKHPDYSESGHLLAVEAAFNNWEALQNTGR